jgi:hypothetical protein
MLYFAYGSNLWLKQMRERCPEHRLIGSGCLHGYRWIITSRGYASIVFSPEDRVFGIVYELSILDELCLDTFEGVLQGKYYKQYLPIVVDGVDIRCMTYIDPITEEGSSQPEYIVRINKGIRDAGLPKEYVEHYLRSFIPETIMEESDRG